MSTSGKRVERWYSRLFDVVVMSTLFLPAAYVTEYSPKEADMTVINTKLHESVHLHISELKVNDAFICRQLE